MLHLFDIFWKWCSARFDMLSGTVWPRRGWWPLSSRPPPCSVSCSVTPLCAGCNAVHMHNNILSRATRPHNLQIKQWSLVLIWYFELVLLCVLYDFHILSSFNILLWRCTTAFNWIKTSDLLVWCPLGRVHLWSVSVLLVTQGCDWAPAFHHTERNDMDLGAEGPALDRRGLSQKNTFIKQELKR